MKLNYMITAIFALLPTWVAAGDIQDEDSMADTLTSHSWSSSFVKHDDFYVELYNFHGKCLTFDPKDDYYAKFTQCGTDPYQDWYYDPFYYSINSLHYKYRDWCLTKDDPKKPHDSSRAGYLRLQPCNGDVYQEWYYSSHNYKFQSGWNRDECMDYCRDCGDYVHTRQCHSNFNGDQQYLLGARFHL